MSGRLRTWDDLERWQLALIRWVGGTTFVAAIVGSAGCWSVWWCWYLWSCWLVSNVLVLTVMFYWPQKRG